MSTVSQETLKAITESIQHNLQICRISTPPRSVEITHFLGNALGASRADYLSSRSDDLLATIEAGLTVLQELTGLNVSFDAASGKFTADNEYSY